jgi:hypothetical protein
MVSGHDKTRNADAGKSAKILLGDARAGRAAAATRGFVESAPRI